MYSTPLVLGQNYIYQGDNKFESTSTWEFKLNSHYWTGDLEVTVAKKANGGLLMLSIDVPDRSNYLAGTVFVFLEDGSVIKCFDKKIKDNVDNQSLALYFFSQDEIEKLKIQRVERIRFSIKDSFGQVDTFTADNKISRLGIDGQYFEYFNTNEEVFDLFSRN